MITVNAALAAAIFLVTPAYESNVTLYASGAGATADDRVKNGEYARTRISTYAELVDSGDVLERVRDELGLPGNPNGGSADLAESISASNPLNSMVIEVTVRDASPQRARAVAGAIGDVYNSVVAQFENSSNVADSPVRVAAVGPASLPTQPVSPDKKLYAVAGLVVGLGLALLLAALRESRLRRKGQGAAAEESASPEPEPGHGSKPGRRQVNDVLVSLEGRSAEGDSGRGDRSGQRSQ